MRRKSSSFRPHDWVYPSQLSARASPKQLSLEQLPIMILESIFNYLQTPDLLQLCLVSRYFYLPAANRLYQNITITGDMLAVTYARDHMQNWDRNYCTVIRPAKTERLLEVVTKNKKLAAMIHSLSITATEEVSLVPSLLSCLTLRCFHYAGILDIPAESLQTIQEMTRSVESTPEYAPNVCELKVTYSNKESDAESFERLALSMIESNSYRNLKKLVFSDAEERNLRLLNLHNVERDVSSPPPPWVSFFQAFSQKEIKLDLMALGLDGFLSNSGKMVAQEIALAVQLSELVTLELNHTEHSHPGQPHDDTKITFLESITNYTPSIQYLSVRPTDNCLACQINSVITTLKENIPHQIKQLKLEIEPRLDVDSETIETIILNYQTNIVKLDIKDRSNSWFEMGQMLRDLDVQQHTQWQDDTFYGERARKAFTPQIFEIEGPRPYLNEGKIESIKLCKKAISKFLESNAIYKGAATHLPYLSEYCVLDVHINIKERGIFVNGETIVFE